jgi:hypothetical protein
VLARPTHRAVRLLISRGFGKYLEGRGVFKTRSRFFQQTPHVPPTFFGALIVRQPAIFEALDTLWVALAWRRRWAIG